MNTLYVLAKRVESGAWDGLASKITQWLELLDRTVEPERKTPKEKLIEEIALRIAYALPYHYCEDDHEAMGWIAEDEEDLVRAAMSVAELRDKAPPMTQGFF